MSWIRRNWHKYAYRHVLALFSQTQTSMLISNSKRLKDVTAKLDALYGKESNCNALNAETESGGAKLKLMAGTMFSHLSGGRK